MTYKSSHTIDENKSKHECHPIDVKQYRHKLKLMWNVSTLQNDKSKMDKRSFYNHDSSMMTIINMHFENQMHVQNSSTLSLMYKHTCINPKHVGNKELKMKSMCGCKNMDSIPLSYKFLNEEHNTSMLTKIKAFTCNLPLPNDDKLFPLLTLQQK